jgi:hypothetical protein
MHGKSRLPGGISEFCSMGLAFQSVPAEDWMPRGVGGTITFDHFHLYICCRRSIF